MPTYKVTRTDILHSEKLYPNGSTIELTKKDAERLADYLELISSEPEIPVEEVKQQEEKQEIKEEVKQEEVKPTKPARPPRPRPVKTAIVQQQTESETIPVASTTTVQAATPPVTTETKPKTATQVPPAAQKVIANAVEQVNKSIQGTTQQGGISYQITPPGNMRSA